MRMDGTGPLGKTGPLRPAVPPPPETTKTADLVEPPPRMELRRDDDLAIRMVGVSGDAQLAAELDGIDPAAGDWKQLEALLDARPAAVRPDPRQDRLDATVGQLEQAIAAADQATLALEQTLAQASPAEAAATRARLHDLRAYRADLVEVRDMALAAFASPHRDPATDHALARLTDAALQAAATPDDRGLGRTRVMSLARDLAHTALVGPGQPGDTTHAIRGQVFQQLLDRQARADDAVLRLEQEAATQPAPFARQRELDGARAERQALVELRAVVENAPIAPQSADFWQGIAGRLQAGLDPGGGPPAIGQLTRAIEAAFGAADANPVQQRVLELLEALEAELRDQIKRRRERDMVSRYSAPDNWLPQAEAQLAALVALRELLSRPHEGAAPGMWPRLERFLAQVERAPDARQDAPGLGAAIARAEALAQAFLPHHHGTGSAMTGPTAPARWPRRP